MHIKDIHNICVVGSGSMGHQIAMLCALGGFQTTIQDVEECALQNAEVKLHDIMDKWVKKGKISEDEKSQAFQRLTFTTSLEEAAANADFVIEAVVEKLEVKRDVFARLDRIAPSHAILVSNSSTIVNSLIADVTGRPDKICNMHFFFPPLVMDCVEVVMGEQTSEKTGQLTMDVCERIGRTGVLLRKEISGFVANRILGALSREAIALYEEGIADFKDIDTICKKALNHPLGPFELMDLSGIDVAYYVSVQRFAETGDPVDKPATCVEEKVKAGTLGRKTGKGWYEYKQQEGAKS
ncbi:3-hydroxyacyl-CoA dehydrogenase family protein [Aneurinibacillus migulanus]|uniref:3-hydroxyacyl-CoA dehydrogenase n=1 Tax=Aneurinibacillus migulanus TaxID=47500 RepID=A0A0D1YFQ7_ANEMI|nr:3-hydroxyacyl-CoA dehydrogenase family protein [Aneurinibacillus migulanus]KIV57737.1 3-hydroxyacyl-CoA dehydrogenase [Aneurinibacillus migulanus]KON97168.1 3-hydroxyacyl-CoA dehydrogenase [Aneurinibacillus migulanus]MED0896391.1 3-hydroxyacyl-CoA dehydrogenase family protein [Aneurinibacillus migulanus]MED1616050.1 3-hydroxyacyl-CoA dehydrogenase family protein [Aneurinibacillus migulanus]SDJ97393.1 3-hydroxybutyryl-CoA dehydrogenase [Aneurinibacillus migulanus]